MWTVASESKTRPHGMNIGAGASRIGAETLVCSTCHMTSTAPNEVPHAPPHIGNCVATRTGGVRLVRQDWGRNLCADARSQTQRRPRRGRPRRASAA